MPIAELFLGALINVLLERLASRELLNFALHEGIDKLLEKWKIRLDMIKHMLDKAEDRQLQGDLEVKLWLENLRNLVYDIDDLLDEFTTNSAKSESKADSNYSKARSLLPSCFFRLSPCVFMFDCKMRSKIKEMDGRLAEIITLKDRLSLTENNQKSSAYPQLDKPDSTTNLTETYFISRDDEKKKILELLTREDLKVIPIIGMPGVGKTALAQQVYNDARTVCFDAKAWVCVSHDFDMLAITHSILVKIDSHLSCENKDLDWLQDNLKKSLSEKKFLVVLDDVWNRNYKKWSELLKPFKSGKKGSKIIITSRDSKIAEIAQAPEFTLEVLSQDACTTLLAFHAFGVGNFDCHPNLKVLGQKIAEKCKGLPLAVTTLGGLLSSNVSPHEWENILNSKIWDLEEESNNIPSALILSYFYLSFDLRRCFAYCAIFPNDYEIERDKLIHWWIADGLLKEKEGMNQWEIGLKNFKELVSRSLLQESSSSESRFLMHDLINDMAKLVAGATYFSSGEFECDENNASLARHASFITDSYILPEKFKIYHGMKRLRSFISLDKSSRDRSWTHVSQKVLSDLFSALKYLRVLSLINYQITEVPESIGKLRHLRHLNLSYTTIKTLPKSIVALYNLEALMLRGCHDLLELPKDIEKLINMRFLDISDTNSLKTMPLYVGNLAGLEMLSKFIVGPGNGSRLKELKNLENLRGELCISNLHMVREARDANDVNLCMKKGICQLTMQWSTQSENFQNEELEAEVLDFLCPHQNLKNLTIFYYGGPKFPSWLGSPTHINIVHLRLHGCHRAKALPSLGQLSSLKELHIKGLSAICKIGFEFYGTESPFPSLITLEFKDMPLWEDWSHPVNTEEVGFLFPLLEHLVIWDCPVLIGRLPSKLSSLVKLKIESCRRLNASPSIISLPSLNKLNFRRCDEGMLKSLVNLTSLTTLVIEEVAELTCLNHGFTSSLSKLEDLKIERCKKLIYLWQDADVIWNLNCLKSLVVESCPKFIDFVAEEGDIKLPSNLETIKLMHCHNLEKLPSKMHTLSSLRDLNVYDCPKLVSFPETGIPTSLISLNIVDLKTLQSLPRGLGIPDEPSSSAGSITQGDMTSCLQDLRIYKCDSLPFSLFNGGRFLSTTLKSLKIRECSGVESLAEINLEPLQSLQEIDFSYCKNLRSLPQSLNTLSQLTSLILRDCPALEMECFPPLPSGISTFGLYFCPKIKLLPNQLHRLMSLQILSITWCEGLTRFPDGGLPPQLQSLSLDGCKNMKQPMREWLTPLTSLQSLRIDGSVGGVGEEEDLVLPLPSSLLHLNILRMGKVERLSSSLPPSLRTLHFEICPKLRVLPHDRLPPSLEKFSIFRCPLLKERCKEGTGCYWPLIHEIPSVIFF